MKLLAIDTSTDYLSLAVSDNRKVLHKFHRFIGRNHSTMLLPAIDTLLKKCRLTIKNIDGFCVSIGPGSFTGLRIGVATVKGLAYCLKKPVVVIPTLDVIAQNAKNERGLLCPVLDARKGKVYACLYRSDGVKIKRLSKYLLLPLTDLLKKIKDETTLFLGDIEVPGKAQKKIDWYPRAEEMVCPALENFKRNKIVIPEKLEPLYLYSRECDIKGI